ncbi:hypothetical protein AAZX31_10G260400 [Glycine max]|uniref:Uncharacterized protein n=1 Tax=Glycine max TaxID=3847 RepID=I1LEW7_SOYBN|nr:uncharacterized protein LOC100815352 [Glycine max]KAG4984561.1 hypothetical protein JHK87_029310 [Glycine soja]KAG5005369.1 hypothetical protein JHK86_029508 [Glycine max]KAG5128558.1 hypothetical protein JHK82_029393 [Glycine max]KAG5153163.1 hypothetical protein JHK84_029635 [Glycine max]KAH1140371.1 hypothetical protein GYH30_029317 [Glycine max]|eukprot:XP_003536683.1 uncharacterized protein LOC100815352 [Glycine max]
MKRQRGVHVNAVRPIMNNNPPNVEDVAAAAMGKKKVKKEGEQKVGNIMVEEEEIKESSTSRDSMVGGYLQQHQQGGMLMGWNWEENMNMPLVGGVVDEQMSWGSTWFPGWDMDLLGGDAFTALYNDVLWDDDIWNLNNQIPIPLDTTKRFHLE